MARTKTDILKKRMLEALQKSLGVVTTACKSVDVARQRHYEWLKKDKKYNDAVETIEGIALDFAESKLHGLINDGNVSATIFYLKCKGKKRGYIEKYEQVIEHKTDVPSQFKIGDTIINF